MRKFPIWTVKTAENRVIREIQESLGISEVLARLLCLRGIRTREEARLFIDGGLDDLRDPFLLPGLAAAVNRLEKARQYREKVLIYGDYDVDGICSVVMLKEFLDYLGVENSYYIPNRFSEGYGLNEEAVKEAVQKQYQLLVTVDCGISSCREIELAAGLGLDVVVTDHHQPPEQLPPAVAIVNPKLVQEPGLQELAGAGVVFKLVTAWADIAAPEYDKTKWLDLVCLATVADIVALLGENRLLVKAGLEFVAKTERPGLRALLDESGLNGKSLKAWHIGYVVAPRLNAAGRIGDADVAVELLLTQDPGKGLDLARFLIQQNRQRQEVEAQILQQATKEVAGSADIEAQRVLVVAGDGWHQGVIGIVASRLTEQFGRPTILISWDEDYGKGSGRSVDGFDLYQALCQCSHILNRFGGHRYAAGLVLERARFHEFREEINRVAASMTGSAGLVQRLEIDCEVALDDIDCQLLNELAMLEPFGEGNPVPNLLLRRSHLSDLMWVGKNSEHAKFWVDNGKRKIEAIAFNAKIEKEVDYSSFLVDLVFQPELDVYNGDTRLVLKVRDMKPSWAADDSQARAPAVGVSPPPPVLLSLGQKVENELRCGRPVVLVYPTLRCLDRHLLSMQSFLSRRALAILSGRQSREMRNNVIRMLLAGENRLFLTTEVLFKYYIENYVLPERLQLLCFVMPEGEATDLANFGRNHLEVTTCLPDSSDFDHAVQVVEPAKRLERAFIYANRAVTVHRLCGERVGLISEAGIDDIEKRWQARDRFRQGLGNGLVSDGKFGLALPFLSEVKEVLFADSPFGLSEALGFMSQASRPEEGLFFCFTEEDLAANRRYLERIFPGPDSVNSFLGYVKELDRTEVAIDKQMMLELNEYMGRKLETTELKAVLQILRELDVCRTIMNNGRVQIVFMDDGSGKANITESLYFLEGYATRKSFLRWCEVCRRARVVI